jgi:hypothetical protein
MDPLRSGDSQLCQHGKGLIDARGLSISRVSPPQKGRQAREPQWTWNEGAALAELPLCRGWLN